MSILKELNKSKKAMLTEDNEIISSVKLLMDGDAAEDLRISRALGRNHSLARAEVMVGKKIELEKLDAGYGGNVFKVEDIKNLCIKYHLRFLKTEYFAGHLDVEVFAKLKAFSKETNTEITTGNLERKFYILAPSESFTLKENRLPRISDDPAIFYKIDEDHYRLIHKWGADFTPLRYLKGLMWRNAALTYWLVFAMIFTVGTIATYLISKLIPTPISVLLYILYFIIVGFFNLISPFWLSPLLNSDISDKSRLYTENTWNSTDRSY